MAAKTDRLRKLETELEDLKRWLDLGMVPKQDIKKHKDEIASIEAKIQDELDKIEYIKQNGQPEEFVTPKRQSNKLVVNDGPSISDLDIGDDDYEENSFLEDESRDYDSQTSDSDTSSDDTSHDDYDQDPFHEKNRWRKREIIDPDSDDW